MWREAARYEPAMGDDERERCSPTGAGPSSARAAGRATDSPRVTSAAGGVKSRGPAYAGSIVMADLKPQVYKDPRPAEYFTPFHERARSARPDWVYKAVRIILTPFTLLFYRTRCDRGRQHARRPGR